MRPNGKHAVSTNMIAPRREYFASLPSFSNERITLVPLSFQQDQKKAAMRIIIATTPTTLISAWQPCSPARSVTSKRLKREDIKSEPGR